MRRRGFLRLIGGLALTPLIPAIASTVAPAATVAAPGLTLLDVARESGDKNLLNIADVLSESNEVLLDARLPDTGIYLISWGEQRVHLPKSTNRDLEFEASL